MAEQSSSCAMQEYYIRKEGDEDSRGPFTTEQLSSLVDAGQVDRQTFYYDAIAEKWLEIQSNAELVAALFPVKKKLAIRQKENIRTVNVPAEDEKPITVEEMLAAAEGKTEETKGKRDLSDEEARIAMTGLRLMSLLLLVSSAGLLVSNMAVIANLELVPILTTPLVVIGLIDLLLALVLFLEVTAVYGIVRVRAAIGFGFFLFYFGTGGELLPVLAVAAGSIGLFVCTLALSWRAVITAGGLGLAGMLLFSYTLLS